MRHGQPGYYSGLELPQRKPLTDALTTGWYEMDALLKLYPGQFIVVTGVAGHGKSTFMQNIICNIARDHGICSFMYVPENEGHVIDKFRRLWGRDKASQDYFLAHQLFVQSSAPSSYDEPAHTIQWVLDQAVIAIEKDNVGFILIDPWNELERAKPKDQLLTDYIGECLMYLKQFCRVYEVTLCMIAHPTKASGNNPGSVPGMADVEGSMNWYNKCDNGLIVWREPDANYTCRVISAKARELGAGDRGVCHFFVDPGTGLFTPQIGADIAKIEAARNGLAKAPVGNKRDNEGFSQRQAGPWNTRRTGGLGGEADC